MELLARWLWYRPVWLLIIWRNLRLPAPTRGLPDAQGKRRYWFTKCISPKSFKRDAYNGNDIW